MPTSIAIERHNIEIKNNLERWNRKPLLQRAYRDFYLRIAQEISPKEGLTVELGSGIGRIREVIPDCIVTDLFDNPWIDRVENGYRLSFSDESISNLILCDVFHHLQYPGTALEEFMRVLTPGGRVIIFEPCLSLLGLMVYGLIHPEPIALGQAITWRHQKEEDLTQSVYYAAQGNASRIFYHGMYTQHLQEWNIMTRKKFSALSLALSGGYNFRQFYPTLCYPFMKCIDSICDWFPMIFSTRLLITLEKKQGSITAC